MAEHIILEKLEYLTNKVDKIEDAVKIIAVQSNRLDTLDRDMAALWKVKDRCSDDMTAIKQFQAQCPRDEISRIEGRWKTTINRQWIAIGIIFSALVAMGGWIKLGG